MNRPQIHRLSDYRPPTYLVDRVELHIELNNGEACVRSKLELRRNPAARTHNGTLELNTAFYQLESLHLNDRPLDPEALRDPSGTLQLEGAGERCTVRSVTRFRAAENTALSGLYRSGSIYCTQCEAEGFRRITPYPDRPDILATFTTTLVADRDECPTLLANGNCIERGALDDNRHFAVWHDPFPKPSYLFALVAGQLDCREASFTTASGRPVALRFYTEPGNQERSAHALACLQRAMRWDETAYGLEYDLDTYLVVAVADFNMGAMENKGLNVFNTQYVLASPETATDSDYEAIEAVIGHEYFHNWTGNRVTCRDWFQLSLKEGLTVFREHQFAAAMGSPGVQRIQQVRLLRSAQFPEDAGPMAHPVRPESYVEINNFYTATVYAKGAEVIRMYHTLLGADAFHHGVKRYLTRYDGQAATIEAFLSCMEEASEVDLEQFSLWYSQAGTPRVEIRDSYDPQHGCYTLHCRQQLAPLPGAPHPEPMHIPLAIGLLGADGSELPVRVANEETAGATTRVFELREQSQSWCIADCPERPTPSLLRGFSAPVVVDYPYTNEALAFLLSHDTDPFARWEAGQRLAERVIFAFANPDQGAEARERGSLAYLQDAFTTSLRDAAADPAAVAEALTLPSEVYLAEQLAVVDPQAVHDAREQLRAHLGSTLEREWLTLHTDGPNEPWRYHPEPIARRRLRNLALAYLNAASERHLELALEQLEHSDNLTDRVAALTVLANSTSSAAETAMNAFHQRWQEEPLVIDKWFRIQATADRPDTVERVERLCCHPDFALDNPNRVRALLGAFAFANPAHFHRPDARGYQLLTEHILTLDRRNPQLAAQLLAPLTRWRRYQTDLSTAMHDQLQRIVEEKTLSNDVYEIASKSLGTENRST